MKKTTSIILALCFILMLSACGSNTKPAKSSDESSISRSDSGSTKKSDTEPESNKTSQNTESESSKTSQNAESGSSKTSQNAESGSTEGSQLTAPEPSEEGNSYKLFDFCFWLPTSFIPSKSNTEKSNRRYYTIDDGSFGSGTIITIMALDTYDGFELGDYASNRSLASISRTRMSGNDFNGAKWYTGEWAAGNFDTYFFVGTHGKTIYEIKIEKGDDNFQPAIKMLKETVWFE